jgi:hypothetical protein
MLYESAGYEKWDGSMNSVPTTQNDRLPVPIEVDLGWPGLFPFSKTLNDDQHTIADSDQKVPESKIKSAISDNHRVNSVQLDHQTDKEEGQHNSRIFKRKPVVTVRSSL